MEAGVVVVAVAEPTHRLASELQIHPGAVHAALVVTELQVGKALEALTMVGMQRRLVLSQIQPVAPPQAAAVVLVPQFVCRHWAKFDSHAQPVCAPHGVAVASWLHNTAGLGLSLDDFGVQSIMIAAMQKLATYAARVNTL